MKIKLKEVDYKIVCLLLAYMPFHYYICEILISGTSIDNIFRDIVLIMLFVGCLHKNRRIRHGYVVGAGIFIMFLFALVSYVLNSYPGTFNILRTYTVPILIFYVAATLKLNEAKFSKLHRIVYFSLAVVGIYGFFQAFILGDDFLIKIGYPQSGGFLAGTSYYIGGFFGYQRVVGTFVSPNICGVILAIGLAAILFNNRVIQKKKIIIVFCIVIGLLGTFSRSAMIAFVVACAFLWMFNGKKKRIRPRLLVLITFAFIVGVAGVYIVDNYFLGHLFGRMLQSSFSGMFSMTDLSAQKHLEDLYQPIVQILEHPFGLGFGNNGPIAIEYNSQANAVESSIYLICYEIGILGAVVYLAPYILLIVDMLRYHSYKYQTPVCVAIICLFTYILLPNIQTYEIIFYFYFFAGLYYNRSVREIFTGQVELRRVAHG